MRYPAGLVFSLLGSCLAWPLAGGEFTPTAEVPLERLTWKHRNPRPIGQGFTGIAAGPDCFIAYGGGGLIMRSVNGIFWEVVPLPIKSTFSDGLFADGEFLLVGERYILTSPDGLRWRIREMPRENDGNWPTLSQVGRHGDRRAVLSHTGVYVSDDGDHWEFWPFTGLGGHPRMAVGPDRILVVKGLVPNWSLLSASSAAGWTETPSSFLGFNSVLAFADGIYVAGNSDSIAISGDGVNWSTHPLPSGAYYPSLRRVGSSWMMTELGTSRYFVSTDLVNWTVRACDAMSILGLIQYREPGVWIAAGDYYALATSTDGLHWTRRDTGIAPTMSTIGRIGGRWVAAGQRGTVISSTDGVNWVPQVLAGEGDIFFTMIADEDVLHVRSDYSAFSTTDGLHWTPGTSLPAAQWDFSSLPEYYEPQTTPSWVGDRWLVPGNVPRVGAGALFSSVDGKSWRMLFQSGLFITSVAGRPGAYVATGGHGTGILFSSDLVSWIDVPVANMFNVSPTIVLEGHGWFLAGTTVGILASPNGRDWQWLPGITSQIYGGARIGGSFWFTGESGTIIEVMPYLEAPIANLSTRAYQRSDGLPTIAGFIIEGSEPVDVLVRAVGDGLRNYDVEEVIERPTIRLHRGPIETMTAADWASSPLRTEIEAATIHTGAFALTEDGGDAAFVARLPAGVYTAVVEGGTVPDGNILVEVYDSGSADGASSGGRLANSSTRGEATVEHPLIGGLVVKGDHPRRVLVRGIGPGLLDYDVANAAADPRLEIYRDHEVIARNDDWSLGPDPLLVVDAAAASNAFALQGDSRDAALVLTLEPGLYTVHVLPAKDSAGGEVLLETYYLD